MVSAQFEEFEPERLVKSTDRVRDLGEVYTPANIVDEMLDLLPPTMWAVHPSPTFLEPSVGNGNFVSAILSRKLTLVDDAYRLGKLPAGKSQESAEFHALEALSSIYGVDISEDNIIGGTPGHEVACRPRLLQILRRWHESLFSSGGQTEFLEAALWIVDHNMIIGNMLERGPDGKRTNRESIPLVEYVWYSSNLKVSVARTTFGDVWMQAEEEQSDVLSLFGSSPPSPIWEGNFKSLASADREAQTQLNGKNASNSRGKK